MSDFHDVTPWDRRLKTGILINTLFVIVEFAVGILVGSLALISDAAHNFSDSLALVFSLFALNISSKPATPQKTFGYHRVGILAAFVNALVLVAISAAIFFESYSRLFHPATTSGGWIVAVAGMGFVLNAAVAFGFRSHGHDLNIKSAFVHLLTDAVVSLGVVAGGIVIMITGAAIFDSLISIIIGAIILYMAWDVMREAIDVLLEAVPRRMDLEDVISRLKQIKGIEDVHDVHIWTLGSNIYALSGHALIDDIPLSESDLLLRQIEEVLKQEFHIVHPTIQFEHVKCEPHQICKIPTRSKDKR